MDISLLLELPAWLVDECELDILSLNKEPDSSIPPFLVIQSASDKGRTKLLKNISRKTIPKFFR